MEKNSSPVSTTQRGVEKIFTPEKCKVRPGTTDSGKDYETKVKALLALKCCSEKLQHFWLAGNVDGCGALDDIILFKKSKENNEGVFYCMQLKHQQTPKNLLQDMFLSTKGDFSLRKYFESYSKLQSTIKDETQKADDVIKHFRQIKKIVFIIFTNKGVNQNGQFLYQVNGETHLNTVRMGGSSFEFNHKTFPDVNADFLRNLFLFTNQPHIKDMDNEIQSAIKHLLHPIQLSEEDLRDITLKFVFFIGEWSNGFLNGHYPITKEHISKKLTELLLLPYMFKLQQPEDSKRKTGARTSEDDGEDHIWYDLTRDKDVMIIDEVDDVVQRYINDATYNILNNKNILDVTTAINKNLLRVVKNPKDMSKSDKYELLWKTRKIPLLLQAFDSEGVTYIQEVLKLFPDVFRVIILNKTKDHLENCHALKNLNEKHQQQILGCSIKLQGRELSIEKLLVNIDEGQFFKSLKVKDMVHILCGLFNIGSNLEPLPEFFVEMSLSRRFFDVTVLESNSEDIFAVKTESFGDFKSFLSNRSIIDENQVFNWKEVNNNNFKGRIIIFDLVENLKEVEECCLTLNKNVHILIWHGNDRLEWVKTNKVNKNENLEKLKKLTEETKIQSVFANEALTQILQNKEALLVSADPGMGKSVLINYFARNVPINFWVLKLNLAKHKDQYKYWDIPNCNSQELKFIYLEKFLKEASKEERTSHSNVFDLVFKQYLKSKNVVLLLDGFDEVPLNCQNGAKKLIKFINESGYYMCAATRPVLQKDLECILNTFAVSLNTFTKDEQTTFLANYFAKVGNITPSDNKVITFVSKLLEAARKNFNDIDNGFTGIPLQTTLLANVFENDFIKYLEDENFTNHNFDLIYLYKHFINKKNEIAVSKVESVDVISQYKKCRSFYALQHLFCYEDLQELQIIEKLKAVTGMIPDIMQIIQKDGIIVTDSDSNVNFVHQTYAEFLVAEWLSENIKTSDKAMVQKLIKKTFDPNFLVVRTMFDRLLAKNCPLHTTIINHQLSTVKEKIDFDENAFITIDEGGRTILHLIAAWGLCHPDSLTNFTDDAIHNDDMMIILKLIPATKLTHAKDDLLNYTPLDYAVHSRSLSVANEICLKIKSSNCCVNVTQAQAESILSYVDTYYSASLLAIILRCLIRTDFQLDFHNENKTSKLYAVISKGNVANVRDLISSNTINVRDHNGCTPLHVAAKFGHTEIARYLLSRKANINERDNKERSALHWASYQGHLDVVSLLITKGAKVSTTDCYNRTALHYAFLSSSTNQCEIASILISSISSSCNRIDNVLNTAWKMITEVFSTVNIISNCFDIKDNCNMNALHWAVLVGQWNIMSLLLTKEVDVNAEGWRNMTALHFAVDNYDISTINLLLTNGANIEAKDKDGRTPLHLATYRGHKDVVGILLKNGSDIKAKDKYDQTSLHLAALDGHKDVVGILLKNGADIEAENKEDRTPLHLAALDGHKDVVGILLKNGADIKAKDKYDQTSLHLAALDGHKDVVGILLKNGADIEAENKEDQTSLHLAALDGHKDVVGILLKNGADIEAENKEYRTPLHLAALDGHKDVVGILLKNGADIEAEDKEDRTPLHMAALDGHKDVVGILLKNGSDIEAKDIYDQTSLHLAAFNGHKDVVGTLLINGANIEAKDKEDQTPLYWAAFNGHKDVVRTLLTNGANIEAKDEDGQTSLIWAAFNGHKDVVGTLLTNGAIIEAKDEDGRTSLSWAAFNGHKDVVDILLNRANIEAKDNENRTPLHWAAFNGHKDVVDILLNGANIEAKDKEDRTPLHWAAFNGHKDVVDILLNRANIEAKDKEDRTPLHWAAFNGHKDVVDILLNGANIEAKDKEDRTPLHLAAYRGHKDVVDILLINGANIEAKDKEDRTPLHVAESKGHKDVVDILLNRANIEAKDKEDRTPLHWAAFNGHKDVVDILLNGTNIEAKDKEDRIPLHLAAYRGHKDVVDILLINGANIEAKDKEDRTPLHLAAFNGHKDVVDILLKNGANIEAKDKEDRTPLHLAAFNGHKDVVDILLKNGANIEAKDKEDRTPLHLAAFNGHKNVVDILLKNGANIEAKDKEDRTPLHLAAFNGHKDVVDILLKNGANIEAKDKEDRTPLHLAAFNGHKDVVDILLKNGANIEAKDKEDRTPLHLAAFNGHKDVVDILLKNGANIEAKDKYDKTSLHWAAYKGHKDVVGILLINTANIEAKDKEELTPLHVASYRGHKDVVDILLINGANIEAKNEDGRTSLHSAALDGHKDVVDILLINGANIEAKDKYDRTPLHLAILDGHKDVVGILLINAANIEAKDKEELTPLHVAAYRGHKDVVDILLINGANIEAKNEDGRTSLHLAALDGHKDVVGILLIIGANIEAKDKDDRTPLHLAESKRHKDVVRVLLNNAVNKEEKYNDVITSII